MNSEAGVLLQLENRRARITLNRPQLHNALHRVDMIQMVEFLHKLNQESCVRSLVLTGTGDRTFCSGVSLSEVSDGITASDKANAVSHINSSVSDKKNAGVASIEAQQFVELTHALAAVRVPTICSLNGSLFGGGVELALCCDFVIGVRGSRGFVPPAKIGLCYAWTGLQRYVALIGLSATKRLLVANETFTDTELLRTGVYHYLVESGERESKEKEIVERIESLAPLAVTNMKRTLDEIAMGAFNPVQAVLRERQCLESDDLRIGLDSHRRKVAPTFTGR